MKAMIFAAGLGTRLRPLTDNTPKALIEINGTPLLEIVLKRLIKFGVNDVIINIHHLSKPIIEFLTLKEHFGINITFSDESDKLLDTGGGLKKAQDFFDDQPFFVHNVDIISDINLLELYKYHFQSRALATLAVRKRLSSRYLLFDGENKLCGWKNIKTNEEIIVNKKENLKELAFSGIQVVDPRIFNLMPEDDVFSIIKFYLDLAKNNIINAYPHNESYWQDVGKLEDLKKAVDVNLKF